MSVNLYNAETNELELLAGASEIPRWSGTQAEFNALDKDTLADGTIIEITDDLSNIFSTWTGTSAEFEALDKSTLADGCYINITDDETNEDWILFSTTTGGVNTNIPLPSSFKELYITMSYSNKNYGYYYPKVALPSSDYYLMQGYYSQKGSGNGCNGILYRPSSNSITLATTEDNGTQYLATVKVFYK